MRNLRNKVRRIVQEELSHNGMVNNERYSRANTIVEAAGKEAMGIAALTGTRGVAVQNFIDDNNLNAKKLFNYLKKGNLSDRMDFITALSGNPNNPYQTKIIKLFSESVIKEDSVVAYDVVYGKTPSTTKPYKHGMDLSWDDALRVAKRLYLDLYDAGRIDVAVDYVGVQPTNGTKFAIIYMTERYRLSLNKHKFDSDANYALFQKSAKRFLSTSKPSYGQYITTF